MAKKPKRRRTLGQFKCTKCGRVFTMAAHLGRHMKTIHGQQAAKPAARVAKATPRGRRKVVRNGRIVRPAPAAASDDQILSQMLGYRNELLAQRAQLDGRIEALDRAIAMLGGSAAAPTRAQRAPARRVAKAAAGGVTFRAGSLKQYIDAVMRKAGKPMRVKDITQGVCNAGYKTSNKTLHKSVGIALTQMPNVKRVSRGVFALK